jgi:hypothetical protein
MQRHPLQDKFSKKYGSLGLFLEYSLHLIFILLKSVIRLKEELVLSKGLRLGGQR